MDMSEVRGLIRAFRDSKETDKESLIWILLEIVAKLEEIKE
jgi:hypothetical protein